MMGIVFGFSVEEEEGRKFFVSDVGSDGACEDSISVTVFSDRVKGSGGGGDGGSGTFAGLLDVTSGGMLNLISSVGGLSGGSSSGIDEDVTLSSVCRIDGLSGSITGLLGRIKEAVVGIRGFADELSRTASLGATSSAALISPVLAIIDIGERAPINGSLSSIVS